MVKKSIFALSCLIGLHLFFLFNVEFTAWPEMFSFPYLVNNGFNLYKDTIHVYPPLLTYILLIVYRAFGSSVEILKYTTWFFIIANDILLFLIAKKISASLWVSIAVLLAYVSIQPFLDGNMLWYDLALVPFVLAGLYSILNKKWFMAGLFFILGAFIKQTALMYLIISGLFIFFQEREINSKLKRFILMPLLLSLTLFFLIQISGSLNDFLNWVFKYPLFYWSKFPGYVEMSLNLDQIKYLGWLVFPLVLVLIPKWKIYLFNTKLFYIFLLFLGSILSVYPRFSFFHFQLSLVLILVIVSVGLKHLINKPIKIAFFLWICVTFLYFPKAIWANSRGLASPFFQNNDQKLAKQIAEHTTKTESVFFLGLHSGLYVLSDRLPPKRWADNYVWYLEIPGVQEEIIARWQNNLPTKIFWKTPDRGNWFDLGTYQPSLITEWIKNNYEKRLEIEKDLWMWELKR